MALEKAGLRYDQIEPVTLGPADAGSAFERGVIDAWSIWEPYASLFTTRPGVRTLATNKDIGEQYSYIMGSGPFVRANLALTATIIGALTATAEKCRENPAQVAALLADATGLPQAIWAHALLQHPFQVLPMNDDLVQSQQKSPNGSARSACSPSTSRYPTLSGAPPSRARSSEVDQPQT